MLLTATLLVQAWPSGAAPVRLVLGAGIWVNGGRVSTLEMVGLNPQPEPPSRPLTLILHTSGASIVVITPTCATSPAPRTYLATGRGSNGRFYQIRIQDNGIWLPTPDSRRDTVGIASNLHPPSPCSDPGNSVPITAGDFIVR
jgi:hypothetical protein